MHTCVHVSCVCGGVLFTVYSPKLQSTFPFSLPQFSLSALLTRRDSCSDVFKSAWNMTRAQYNCGVDGCEEGETVAIPEGKKKQKNKREVAEILGHT